MFKISRNSSWTTFWNSSISKGRGGIHTNRRFSSFMERKIQATTVRPAVKARALQRDNSGIKAPLPVVDPQRFNRSGESQKALEKIRNTNLEIRNKS